MAEPLIAILVVLTMYFSACWFCYRWGRYELLWKEESLRNHLRDFSQKNEELRRRLDAAERNDARDPATGRYKRKT